MTLSEDHDDGSATFARLPNELKLMFAEQLGIHDVNALARTCREMNELLTQMMYRRAKDSNGKRGRPYFLLAVDGGNLAAVKRFVEVGASINMTHPNTSRLPPTAIRSCAHFGHAEIAEFLIDKGINVWAADRGFGHGVLHNLVMGKHPKEAMVTLLVEAGADLKTPWCWNTPLHMAAAAGNVRIVQRLLDLGADPNAADVRGVRPVHTAASLSDPAMVRCLLEAGKNVEIADHDGTTPLHKAARWGATENVKVLLQMGADTSSVDRLGNTPLMLAVPRFGNEGTVHRILHLGRSIGYRPRETFAECVSSCQLGQSNHTAIEMLLAAGADIAKVNSRGHSPMAWAAARACAEFFRFPFLNR